MIIIQLNQRQQKIIEIVKQNQPITSENIASMLNVTRATLRSDLAILTMTGILDARPKVGYFYTGISQINLLGNDIKEKQVGDIMGMPVVVKKDVSLYDVIVEMFLSEEVLSSHQQCSSWSRCSIRINYYLILHL